MTPTECPKSHIDKEGCGSPNHGVRAQDRARSTRESPLGGIAYVWLEFLGLTSIGGVLSSVSNDCQLFAVFWDEASRRHTRLHALVRYAGQS